jgi:hypothetical protein
MPARGLIILLSVVGMSLLVAAVFLTGMPKEKYAGNTTRFRFKVPARKVAPVSGHPLSENGPYIDVHLKDMNIANPIGETYYQRPLTSYNTKDKILAIYLDIEQPTIHMNSNTVSTDISYGGVITISDFTYGEYNPDSVVDVDVAVCNKTGRELIGFHIHDGELSRAKGAVGFTNFGPIAYFMKTTQYWIDRATELSKEGKFPLPLSDAISRSDFPLHTSR